MKLPEAGARLDEVRRALAIAFAEAGMADAAADARRIVQLATGLSRTALVSGADQPVDAQTLERVAGLARRRLAGEPVSRLRGSREFYGRDFVISPAVLDPRADTETLVDAALQWARQRDGGLRILDIGTGSGAILVTLVAELPQASGVGTDISSAALAIAQANADTHIADGRAAFVQTAWTDGVDGPFDLIVSNPPYIPHGDIAGLDREVREHDPLQALDGGSDGLEAFRAILPRARGLLAEDGRVIVEFGAGQAAEVIRLALAAGLEPDPNHGGVWRDLAGHERCAILCAARRDNGTTPC